jgi:hypothetical protein
MFIIYDAENIIDANLVRDYLTQAGIEVFIQGEWLVGGIGELPADTRPHLWVKTQQEATRAQRLLQIYKRHVDQSDWQCPHCEEYLDASFEFCWRCGHILDPSDNQ